jgi:MFS family permease
MGLTLDGVADDVEEPGFTLRQAWRTRAFWLLTLASLLPPMIGTAMLFDIQPLLAMRGIDEHAPAFAVSAWSATMAIAALPTGRLVDVVQPARVISAGTFAIAVSCAVLLAARSAWMAIAALALYAIGQTLVASAAGAAIARYFGRRHHGAIRSSLARLGVIATGLGPLAFGASLKLTAGYAVALIGFAALCIPVAIATLWLAAPPALVDEISG